MPKSLILKSVIDRWVYVWTLVLLASLSFSTALMEISCVALVVGFVFLRIQKTPLPEIDKTILIPLLVYISIAVISFFWSEFPKQSFRGVLKVLKGFLVFWMAVEVLTTRQRHQTALGVLTISLIFLGLDGMWQYVFGQDFTRRIPYEAASSGPRISASFRNYGLLAAYVIAFVPVVAGQIKKKTPNRNLFLSSLASIFGLLLLFWTRLRGAWIAFLVGIGFCIVNAKNKKIYAVILAAIVVVGFLVLPKSKLIHLDAEGKEQSLIERVYLWERAVQVIKARPFTGTGINTYAVAHQKYDQRKNWRVQNYYAHNGYLQLAAETGLPSLGFFLAFLFFYFRKGLKTIGQTEEDEDRKTLTGFLAGLVNFLVLAFIDTIFHNPASVMAFWFLAGWGLAFQTNVIRKGREVSGLKH